MEILMDMDMENYEDGDTLPLPVVRATETKGGKALMSLFDEPVETVQDDEQVGLKSRSSGVKVLDGDDEQFDEFAALKKLNRQALSRETHVVVKRSRPGFSHQHHATHGCSPRTLCALVLTLVLSTAAAFACSARGTWSHRRSSCGDLGKSRRFSRRNWPRSRALKSRRSQAGDEDILPEDDDDDDDDEEEKNLLLPKTPMSESEARKAMALLLHQDPSADPSDFEAVVASTSAEEFATIAFYRTADWWAERTPSLPTEESLARRASLASAASAESIQSELARIAGERGLLQPAGDLGLSAHVLKRLAAKGIFDAHPEISLLDGLSAAETSPYLHAHQRDDDDTDANAALEPDADGNYNLELWSYVLRDMEKVLHENPAMDISDLIALKKDPNSPY